MQKIQLQVNPAIARKLHRTAPAELKTILEESAPQGFFSIDPTERIRSYEDACEELGIEPMNETEMLRMGFRQDEIDRRKLETITFALNDGECLDWNNSQQEKWYPWFDFSAPSGFAFDDTYYRCSGATAGIASRLCLKDAKRARYAGETFIALYKSVIDNKPTE